MSARKGGFTLIELMIVVVIIATLAAVAVPKFSELIRKSKEGSTKGNLGRIRSALSAYYSDNEGHQPTCNTHQSNSGVLSTALIPRFIDKIPQTNTGQYHTPTNSVYCHQTYCCHDGEGWQFHGWLVGSSDWNTAGSVTISCSHTDTKRAYWYSY